MNYSDLHTGRTIIHVVAGKMNDDLLKNIGKIAQWFVDNDITLLWGDDYQAEFDENHPVKVLADEIRSRGGNAPIRILQLGVDHADIFSTSAKELGMNTEDIRDRDGNCIGVLDKDVEDEIMIYTDRQQARQILYYQNADALMVLNGGIGAAYEIPNSIIYGFSGDVASHFKTIIIDNPDDCRFKKSTEAYLKAGGLEIENLPQVKYYASAEKFVEDMADEITTKNENEQ